MQMRMGENAWGYDVAGRRMDRGPKPSTQAKQSNIFLAS